jgi:hypothetical protein
MKATTKILGAGKTSLLGALLLLPALSTIRADVVTEWNVAMNNYAAPLDGVGALAPYIETRAYAMAHIAMLNAIKEAQKSHHPTASAEAAGAQAAHDVLVHEFSDGASGFDALLATELAAIPTGPGKNAGITIGMSQASKMIQDRANDGSATPDAPYTQGTDPGDYQPTPPFDGPPFNGYVAAGNWSKVKPFIIKKGDQFRVGPPYKVTDLEYTFDVEEIKALGSVNSTGRSDDQTQLAIFWYESCGLGWNRIGRLLASQHPRDLLGNAQVFATLNATLADAYIAAIDSKFTYNFWRPITAIRSAATDGNDLTSADSAWEPLLLTPPIPDYPSAHSCVGAAAAAVLAGFFGDENTFSFSSTMSAPFPSVGPRTFHHISDAAKENSTSRMFVGIHFRLACTVGFKQGTQLGSWIFKQQSSSDDH